MKKLKVDLKELISEMEMGENLELSGYLDTETGEIISMPDNVMRAVENSDEAIADLADWEEDTAETAEKILSDEKNRFLLIPKRESREGYEIMVAFTASVRRKGLREKLSVALNGKGAFRRFRSVLNDYPDELEQWYSSRMTGCGKKRSSGSFRTALSRCRQYPATSTTTEPRSMPSWSRSRACVLPARRTMPEGKKKSCAY
jgi:hypothetical protein